MATKTGWYLAAAGIAMLLAAASLLLTPRSASAQTLD